MATDQFPWCTLLEDKMMHDEISNVIPQGELLFSILVKAIQGNNDIAICSTRQWIINVYTNTVK